MRPIERRRALEEEDGRAARRTDRPTSLVAPPPHRLGRAMIVVASRRLVSPASRYPHVRGTRGDATGGFGEQRACGVLVVWFGTEPVVLITAGRAVVASRWDPLARWP